MLQDTLLFATLGVQSACSSLCPTWYTGATFGCQLHQDTTQVPALHTLEIPSMDLSSLPNAPVPLMFYKSL